VCFSWDVDVEGAKWKKGFWSQKTCKIKVREAACLFNLLRSVIQHSFEKRKGSEVQVQPKFG
jgi:hypothetical protein